MDGYRLESRSRRWLREAITLLNRLRLPGASVLPVAGGVVGLYSGLAAGIFANLLGLTSGIALGPARLLEAFKPGSATTRALGDEFRAAEWHGEYLLVGVKGGGCSGFQYSLNFTDEIDEDDVLVVVEGVKVVTYNFSASYLKGTELDYVETLQGACFKFNNPNAKRTCGCGSSFSA